MNKSDSAAVLPASRPWADFVALTKPRVNLLVLVTTVIGFHLGNQGGTDLADVAVAALTALPRARLTDDALVVVEHAHREPPPERAGFLIRTALRRYGDTALSLYRIEPEREATP